MEQLISKLQNLVGDKNLLTGDDVSNRSDEWPAGNPCLARAIVRPENTAEVSSILKLCHAAGQTVVTHGGLTGLVHGARASSDDIVISLERMRSHEPVDAVNRTLTVDAGVPLQTVQETAEAADLLFPLDFGARGSATIGGLISTNAGGNGVIRYGMAREQVLGIEAVLADGTIISSMNTVIKNNTGYDLKQLFIGSEGTLGVVTRAVLRLRALPRSQNSALVAITDFKKLSTFLQQMDSALGGTLSAFEVMWNDFFTIVIGDGTKHGEPLATTHPYYVLIESSGSHDELDGSRFELALGEAFESELIIDAVIAQSKQQQADLWAIRDDIEALAEGLMPPIPFDISLSIDTMEEYVNEVRLKLEDKWPAARIATFGHLGDGNIHLIVTVDSLENDAVHAVEEIVYSTLAERKGVISAEHGIGLDKRDYLHYSRSSDEITLMKTLKTALDPKCILNPGKIIR